MKLSSLPHLNPQQKKQLAALAQQGAHISGVALKALWQGTKILGGVVKEQWLRTPREWRHLVLEASFLATAITYGHHKIKAAEEAEYLQKEMQRIEVQHFAMDMKQGSDTLLKYQQNKESLIKKASAYFVYTEPLKNQGATHYSLESDEKLQGFLDAYQHDKDENTLVYNLLEHYEGAEETVYRDSQGYKTIGIGYLMTPKGRDKKREKEFEDATDADYQRVYKGKEELTPEQMQKLLKAHLHSEDGLYNQFDRTLNAALENAQAGAVDKNNIDPVHRAVIISMLYQCPNFLRGNSATDKMSEKQKKRIEAEAQDVRAVTYPLLRHLCNKDLSAEEKEQAMIQLCAFNQTYRLERYQADKPLKGRLALAHRANSLASLIGDNQLPIDMVATQLRVAQRDQRTKNPQIVLAGRFIDYTAQDVLMHPLCHWDDKRPVTIHVLSERKTYRQKGQGFEVEDWTDTATIQDLLVPQNAMQDTQSAYTKMQENFASRGSLVEEKVQKLER